MLKLKYPIKKKYNTKSVMKQTSDAIVNEVINLHKKRHKQGIKKFKKTMVKNNKPMVVWLNDVREEAMDIACYVTKIINIIKNDKVLKKLCEKRL